jgi:chemotaxis protein histidine kinase CheA
MNAPQEQFRAFLELQRADYQRALPAKLAQLQALWLQIEADPGLAGLAELERLAHTLSGTAGTFGFSEVGRAARLLEELLTDVARDDAPLTPDRRAGISRAVAALCAILQAD